MFSGEKLTEEEVEQLMIGQEDTNGCVNYEGIELRLFHHHCYLVSHCLYLAQNSELSSASFHF